MNYGRQSINDDDISAVVQVLKSDFLTQGPVVNQFEGALTQHCQSKHCVAVCNGTAALHLACLALNISESDRVWVSSVSFVASANSARYCNAQVDFIDIDASSGLICVDTLETKLLQASEEANLPTALIVVHLAGQSCDMERIQGLCRKYDIRIIEDACHALGASYKDAPVGSCQHSDICIFSFHPVKPITSGEGGALLTNCDQIAEKARLLANHGITKDSDKLLQKNQGPWYYEMQELGFNYRLTDIQAALGMSQLKRLEALTTKRQKLAQLYTKKIQESELPITPLLTEQPSSSAFHLYVVRYSGEKPLAEFYRDMASEQIHCQLHYIPIFLQPYYQKQNKPECFPGAMQYYATALSLPLYPDMGENDIDKVLNVLAHCCR